MASLVVGDRILGLSEAGEVKEQEITQVVRSEARCIEIFLEAGSVVCSLSHHVVDFCGNIVLAAVLEEGDLLKLESMQAGVVQRVVGCEMREVVGLTCSPDHTYFAGGILHHNHKRFG